MARPKKLPIPPTGPPREPAELVDADTGKPVKSADLREEFKRLSSKTPRDKHAERAFIENKIKMVEADPSLSQKEKTEAIAELRRALP
jgi:hypothetical protein